MFVKTRVFITILLTIKRKISNHLVSNNSESLVKATHWTALEIML